MITRPLLEEAAERITPYIRLTALTYAPDLDLYLKWENQQETGSFKIRGAYNKVLALPPADLQRGLVAASAGNHGQGVALAGGKVGARTIVFASEHATLAKVEAMRRLGADVRLVPGGYGDAERAGIAFAHQAQATWVSPYNDPAVIAGQGTLGLELLHDLPPLADFTWIVPAGGGGLVAGIGAALQDAYPRPRLVAAQSEASPFLYHLFHHGSQDEAVELPSLADGLSGPVESGAITIDLVKRYVDDFVLVSEAEIQAAIAFAWVQYQEKIEGAAAVSLAAVLTGKVPERPAVAIITGGNIQPELHARLVAEAPATP